MLENAILEHAKALNNLAEAIRSMGDNVKLANTHSVKITNTFDPAAVVPAVAEEKVVDKPKKTKEPEATGPFYWEDTETGWFGKEDTVKMLNKQLGTKDTIKQINEERYDELVVALREKNAAAKAVMDAKPKEEEPAADLPEATLEDVIACFTKYLPKDLAAAERKKRHEFVKPLLARFGAAKATKLPAEHRALAINIVERKMAGEDIDPETAEFEEAGVI